MSYIKTPRVLLVCCGVTISLLCACAHEESSRIDERKKTMSTTQDQPLIRPQEPKPPYPYAAEEVSFENMADGIMLSGTLTLPKASKPVAAMLLISGMGPNDRDYTMMGHKLFLVLADHLTRQGIAVLRYDKRGVGQSTGMYDASLTSEDFARDARAGIDYLKTRPEIDSKQIGLIGHSEGGMIAAMVAAQVPEVAFVVSLAAPMSTNIETIVAQVAYQLRADGASDAMVSLNGPVWRKVLAFAKDEADPKVAADKMRQAIEQYLRVMPEAQKVEAEKLSFAITAANADGLIEMFNSPWYRFFLHYDPAVTLKKLKMPVLVLNGDHDWIALSSISLPIARESLKGNKSCAITEMPNMNHWFQTCKTGALAEYGALEETMSPVALHTISQWIVARVK